MQQVTALVCWQEGARQELWAASVSSLVSLATQGCMDGAAEATSAGCMHVHPSVRDVYCVPKALARTAPVRRVPGGFGLAAFVCAQLR